jgi:superfamily II DNA helicase RecQ
VEIKRLGGSTNGSTANATRRKRRKTEKEVVRKLEDDMADGLRTLLGPEATWRSDKQAESMRSIMSLKTNQTAINVLLTGAGKSILSMLSAVMQETGTSIVVVPFVALMEDLVTRATAMGVDCIRFRSSLNAGREGLSRAARLVVVSADIVSSPEFSGHADALLFPCLL